MDLEVTVDGDTQLQRTLTRFAGRVQDVSPAFAKIADTIATGEEQQFTTEGRYGSGGWAALSPKYRAWKERRYPGMPILVRTGALRASLTQRPFGVEHIGPLEMTIGTALPYSRFHQQGTARMPQRRPLELPDEERTALVKVLQKFIVSGEV
ncbi:MAG: phage virion morphogenesis protein [Actinomycetota bacterium]|nr:phage virion morphogenesis protein [Actinomycetota bacterium]